MKKRYLFILSCAVVLSVIVLNAPAAWLSPLVWRYSKGMVSLERSWGSIWQGTAQLRIHRSGKETLLIPETVSWDFRLNTATNPLKVTINLKSNALKQAVTINVQRVSDSTFFKPVLSTTISAGTYHLPIQHLSDLGAPFNTLKPSGNAVLSWNEFTHLSNQLFIPMINATIDIQQLRMSITGDLVLGSYRLLATPASESNWFLSLNTLDETLPSNTKLILNGVGKVLSSKQLPIQFELRAKAATTTGEESVNVLLNLLGRKEGAEHVLRINP
jgi:general secretion pathway protein N